MARAAGRDGPFSFADVENRRTTYLAAEMALHVLAIQSDPRHEYLGVKPLLAAIRV